VKQAPKFDTISLSCVYMDIGRPRLGNNRRLECYLIRSFPWLLFITILNHHRPFYVILLYFVGRNPEYFGKSRSENRSIISRLDHPCIHTYLYYNNNNIHKLRNVVGVTRRFEDIVLQSPQSILYWSSYVRPEVYYTCK